MIKKFLIVLFMGIVCFGNCQKAPFKNKAVKPLNYPQLNCEPVTDNYFGMVLKDEFRLIEDLNNTSVKQWFSEEKKLYNEVTNNLSGRDSLQKEIERLLYSTNIRSGTPRTSGNKVFFERRFLKEKVQKLFYREGVDGKEQEIFSTGSLNNVKQSYRIDYFEPSYDGRYVALGISFSGTELSVLQVLDVDKKVFLPDSIERARFGNPQWLADGSGFFYKQLKELDTEEAKKTRYEDSRIKFHRLGTNPLEDKEVFSRSVSGNQLEIDKLHLPYLYTFPQSDVVIAGTLLGTESYYDLYYTSLKDLLNNSSQQVTWKTICKAKDKVTSFTFIDDQIFLLSFASNSNGQIKSMRLQSTESKVILEGKDMVLQEMVRNNSSIFLKTLKNGVNKLFKLDPQSLIHTELKLPYEGTLALQPGFKVWLNNNGLYFLLGSWTNATKVYYYNSDKKQFILTNIRPEDPVEKIVDLEVREVEIKSHDDVLVPLSIVYDKSIRLNSKNPTLLYGYGAFGVSLTALFDPANLAWLRRGGIYAVAHVRGGGEKGDSWYKGGYKATKSNSWKDFIACAEYLISNKYTSPQYLVAEGASAGGITIGRALTDRPELFKSAVILYGKLNNIRHENTFNTASIAEYGTVKDSMEVKYLYDMDVYHHIKEGVKYPSILFSTGMNDARVEAWQPAKVVAKMQKFDPSNVILFRISDEGHFGEINVVKELADKYSFLLWQLGHKDFKYIQNTN